MAVETTEVPVELLSAVVGNQLYVFAPLTVIVVDAPLHILVLLLVVKVGLALTVATTVFNMVHPVLAVPIML